jgi:hypothetical protein
MQRLILIMPLFLLTGLGCTGPTIEVISASGTGHLEVEVAGERIRSELGVMTVSHVPRGAGRGSGSRLRAWPPDQIRSAIN